MQEPKPPLRYEDAAELTTIEVWRCLECWKCYPLKPAVLAEYSARTCCAQDKPCSTEGCTGRVLSRTSRTLCEPCDQRHDAEKWASHYQNAVAWDGETPLAIWDGDRYFWSADDIESYLENYCDDNATVADLRLVLCEPASPRPFRLEEYLADDLPDPDHGGDGLDCDDIDRLVNQRIKDLSPLSWFPSGVPVTTESVESWVGEEFRRKKKGDA